MGIFSRDSMVLKMNVFSQKLFLLIMLAVCGGCASYKESYSHNTEEFEEYKTLFHSTKNVFFAKRCDIVFHNRKAIVEYKIINILKKECNIEVGKSIFLSYYSDGESDIFNAFIRDDLKKFALIFIDDFLTKKFNYYSLGDGYSIFYIPLGELNEKLLSLKIKEINCNNWEKNIDISGRLVYLLK